MTDYAQYQYGSAVFPESAGTLNASLLAACDPALAKLIDFLPKVLDRYLGQVLTRTLGQGTPPAPTNVAFTLSVDPATVTKTDQVRFPLFCLWRKSAQYDYRTENWRQRKSRLGWQYILPAMTVEQSVKFAHVLNVVELIVDHALYQGFDPFYNNGERVIYDGQANRIGKARTVSSSREPYLVSELNAFFHSTKGEIEISEIVEPYTAGLSTLLGTDLTVTDESVEPGDPVDVIDATLGS